MNTRKQTVADLSVLNSACHAMVASYAYYAVRFFAYRIFY